MREKSREKTYIELPKPIFAGWDISIVLTESGMRRRDAPELQEVMNVLNVSREMFTKDVNFVKHIRNNKHFIDSIKSYYQHRGYHIDNFSNRHITYHEFHNLPEHLKKYFYEDKWYKYSSWQGRFNKPHYGVRETFPWYECVVKITRSFYNYRVVYDTIAKSEYDKLDGYLYVWDMKTWSRYRDSFVKANKAAYRKSLNKIVSFQYTPEQIIDEYSNIFKGANNNRNYGWS